MVWLIPIVTNKFLFKQRESCRQIDDRKWHSINPIQFHLRSSIFGALTRLNRNLFVTIGITLFFCIPLYAYGATQDAITLDIGVRTIAIHDDSREKLLLTEVYYPSDNVSK